MACFLLHTSHTLSNIYNSAKFPDQSEHLQTIGKTKTSSFVKLYGGEWTLQRTSIGQNIDTENVHACASFCICH